ncbi:SDR family oxidoreductase [Saccharopolyspora erythraea]|uniref:SDR family oxidoreductase n=1 Tax=Saccharopolyspora erythraea TaxID=1836 RepID=UPI00201297C6|nr:SDR family oxidoreductase [Saccharopolyspora erythraea]
MSVDQRGVAITGATGFLGVHLVAELLDRHRRLIVLARRDRASVLDTMERRLRLLGVPERVLRELPERLKVVRVELTRPRLGLIPAAFQLLADRIDRIWHCAGDTTLDGSLSRLREVNVAGTRHVLDLAAAGERHPLVHHTSTIGVAGSRRYGLIPARVLDDEAGFECNYERSKYEAETLVQHWAVDRGRPVVVHRPSVLITDRPHRAEMPLNPLTTIARLLHRHLTQLGLSGEVPEQLQPVVRVPADRTASVNLVQARHAAAVMARLGDHPPSAGVLVHHVVHQRDMLVPDVLAVLERMAPVRLRVVPAAPPDTSPLEAVLQAYPVVQRYLRHHRRFDSSGVRALLGERAVAEPIDADYLLAGLRSVFDAPARL